jgi:hypothetical protein
VSLLFPLQFSTFTIQKSEMSKLLVVLSATEYMIPAMLYDTCDILLTCPCYMIRMQGGSAVATYLKRHEWKIRAITLYPSKPAAKQLEEQGVEIVLADFNDGESLCAAFKVNRPKLS